MSRLFVLLAILVSSSCSSLLYYPSRKMFVDPQKLPIPPEEIAFHVDEGNNEKLVAWKFQSQKTPSKGVVVYFHGNAQNLSTHFFAMYWVLSHGYDLFVFDYPGYGGSHGKPTPENTLESGHKAIEYVQKNWPNSPILVAGGSLGGAIALRTVIDQVEMQKASKICLVAVESTFDSFQKIGQEVLARQWWTWPFQWMPYIVLSDRYSPYGRIHEVSPIPLVIFHRLDDPIIPSFFGNRIYERAKDPKTLYLQEGNGHVDAFHGPNHKKNRKIFLKLSKKYCQ